MRPSRRPKVSRRPDPTPQLSLTFLPWRGVKRAYRDSELRLVETLEAVCGRLGDYSIHKEREGSARFARGRSQTMDTLHSLVDKGVKVDLGQLLSSTVWLAVYMGGLGRDPVRVVGRAECGGGRTPLPLRVGPERVGG